MTQILTKTRRTRTAKPLKPLAVSGCDNVTVERMLPFSSPIQNRT